MNEKVIVSHYGGPDVLELHKAKIPQPEADELIIKVAYAGVGAIDAIMRAGKLKELNLQPPFTPGIEVSGTVQATGTAVTGFEIGQSVAAIMLPDGGYANYVRAKATLSVPVPSKELLLATASIVNLVTAYLLLTELTRLSADDRIVIHGAAGGLGTACVQVLRMVQPAAHITATVRDTSKKAYLKDLGCQAVLTTEEFVHGEIDKQAYSLIIDPVGGELRRTSLTAMRPYGKLLAIGNVSDDYESGISSQQLWLEGKAVIGFNLALFASLYGDKVHAAMQAIIDALAAGKLAPTPTETFSLDKVQQAHQFLQSGSVTGRVLLKVDTQ
jgi:NADPH2:quinone reductase